MARRKKKELPKIDHMVSPLAEEFSIRLFPIHDIPEAVVWAERGNIAIHENYHSRRRQSYHVICGAKERLEEFCMRIGVPKEAITASEFFRFWHLTWFPHLTAPKSGDNMKSNEAVSALNPSAMNSTQGNRAVSNSGKRIKDKIQPGAVSSKKGHGKSGNGCTIHRIR